MGTSSQPRWCFASSPADLIIESARDVDPGRRVEAVSPQVAARVLAAHLREASLRAKVTRLHRAHFALKPTRDDAMLADLVRALERGALVATWRAGDRGPAPRSERDDEETGALPDAVRTFEVMVIDDEATPVVGVEVRFTLEGRTASAKTDRDGVARVEAIERDATAEIASAALARERLRASWRRPRVFAPEAIDAVRQFPKDPMEAVTLEPGRRRTVMLLPFVMALRLPMTLVRGRRVVLSAGGDEARCDASDGRLVEHAHVELCFVVGEGVPYAVRVEGDDGAHTILRSPDLAPSLARVDELGATRALPESKRAEAPASAPVSARGWADVLSAASVYGDFVERPSEEDVA